MSLPLTPSPPNETSTLLRCSFLAYTSPHTARGDSVEAGAEKPTGLCAAASYSQSTSFGKRFPPGRASALPADV